MGMVDKAEEAFQAKVASRVVMGCIAGFAALVLALLLWGGSSIYNTSVSQQLMAQQVTTLVTTVAELKTDLAASTVQRYTSGDASRDRASIIDLINVNNTNMQQFFTNSSARNIAQDEQLRVLNEFKARVEERMKMDKAP